MVDERNLVKRIRLIKANLAIDEAITEISGVVFTGGEDTRWPEGKDVCPCGEHQKNFRVSLKQQRAFCHTPGCNAKGDLIDFVQGYLGVDLLAAVNHIEMLFGDELDAAQQDASKLMAVTGKPRSVRLREYQKTGIQDPTDEDFQFMLEIQRLFEVGLSESQQAQQYLTGSRGHSATVLKEEGVGYVASSLRGRLGAIGNKVKLDKLERYGLLTHKRKDIAMAGLISFPMRDLEGRVCGFRFKDPRKQQMAQQRRNGILGDTPFLGMHTLKGLLETSRVMLVEGEHDWLSVRGSGWSEGLLATCGTLSYRHIAWIREHIGDRSLVTLFDNDHGGEKYREEVAENLPHMSVIQYVPAGYKADPNSVLRSGGDLAGMLAEERKWQK